MVDIPGLDMISPFLGPAAGAAGGGMDASGSIADAASSVWDYGSNAIANIGESFDPSLIAGPLMPRMAEDELPLGLMDVPSVADVTADYQQDFLY